MQGQVQDALQVLATALSLSAGQGYQTSFVDGGEPVRQLLEEIVHWPNAEQTVKESAAQILERTQKVVEDRHAPVMGQPELSEREREVLTLMADGLSNKDIAAQLFISITTVKTHIGNIFNKLGVSNRIQAVARGESLGLLPRR